MILVIMSLLCLQMGNCAHKCENIIAGINFGTISWSFITIRSYVSISFYIIVTACEWIWANKEYSIYDRHYESANNCSVTRDICVLADSWAICSLMCYWQRRVTLTSDLYVPLLHVHVLFGSCWRVDPLCLCSMMCWTCEKELCSSRQEKRL